MIQGMQIDTLISRLVEDAKSKLDFIAPATTITLEAKDELHWGEKEHAPLTKNGMDQLSTYLGIPSRFIDRLQTDDPELIRINVNRLLQTKTTDRRMIRTLRGQARAFLSDQYRRLDHEDVAEKILPMVHDYGYSMRSATVTDSRLYLHVISPKTEGEIRKGDPVRFGWIIQNSEVGKGSMNIQLFMEVLACLNGAIIPEFSKKRAHIGGRAEMSEDSYLVNVSNETQRAADAALWGGVRDHVREFSTPAGIKRVFDRIKEQTDAPVTGDPTAVVEALANKFVLREEEQKSVLYSFLEHNDRTRWGLHNAVTQLANDNDDYDRAVELERIGGLLLMSGASDWKSISAAVA